MSNTCTNSNTWQ